jgi:hypothetical protein
MRTFLNVVSGGAALLGLAAFGRGWNTGEDVLVQMGRALVVAALTLFGVAAGLSTWRDERDRAREVQQRETYAQLVHQLFLRFTDGEWDQAKEAELRAKVVTWADPPVVIALDQWLREFDKIVPAGSSGTLAIDADQAATMRRQTALVAQAVRGELAVTQGASVEQVEGALFNTPKPLEVRASS